MAMFDTIERDFNVLMQDATRKITEIPDLSGDAKERQHQSCLKDIQDMKELVEQMDMDVNPSNRARLAPRIKQHKEKLSDTERNLRRSLTALSNSAAAREELFAYDGTNEDQKQALLSNADRLERATDRLDEGLRMVHETTQVGVTIMQDLNSQREQIERSRRRVGGINNDLGKANRTLTSMYTRAKQNKFVTFGIILVAIGIIVLIAVLVITR
eukprot:m.225581 g.225581  ORF g.225581 m.225581 type:complete len:214 (+) comp16735_c0_seq1:16-657(+)